MNQELAVRRSFHVHRQRRGRKMIHGGIARTPNDRIPRVSRLMALTIHFDQMLRNGLVENQAELARLGHVSRARLTQIMNLALLAPDIQEQLLFLGPVKAGQQPIRLQQLQPLAAVFNWQKQRRMWTAFVKNRVKGRSDSDGHVWQPEQEEAASGEDGGYC